MLSKLLMGLINNVEAQLQSKPISPLLATPRTIGCFLLGYQLYNRFIDHEVRKKMALEQNSPKMYLDLLFKSQYSGAMVEDLSLAGGFVSSLLTWYFTKNKLWILGGGLFLGMLVFKWTFKPVIYIMDILGSYGKPSRSESMKMKREQKNLSLIKKWKVIESCKIAITILAIIIFYTTEVAYSQKVDLKISYKK